MRIERHLDEHQRVTVDAAGTSLYLEKGEAVEVTTVPTGRVYELRERDQITLPHGESFTALNITNLGRQGDVSLVHVHGIYQPSIDGSKLEIESSLTVKDVLVEFLGRQPVALPSDQHVNASIKNLPDVQKVELTNPTPPPDIQKVNVVAQSRDDLTLVPFDAMTQSGTITGNIRREELIIRAADANPSTIWIGGFENKGYPLRAGEGWVLSNGAKLDVLIPTDCVLYVTEVTA